MRFLPFLLLLSATMANAAAAAAARLPVVVTANTILDDLVRQVGGDQVTTSCLIQPGADPHTFEPRPSDVKLLVAADLLVINGLDLEPAVLRLAANCGFRSTIVVATTGITSRTGGCTHDHDHAEHTPPGTPSSSSASSPSTSQSQIGNQKSKIPSATPHSATPHSALHNPHSSDPHAWQDPRNVAVYVANIRDALIRANPASSSVYESRATAYLAQLTELDRWAREQIATIPAARRKLVTSHDSLGYFAAAYDFEAVPVSGLSTTTEPNARDVAAIINLIRREQVPAVFFEVTSNPKLVRQIGADAGVGLAEPLFTDSLNAGESYLAAMRTNVARIVSALKP